METPVFRLDGNAFMARYGAGEAKNIRDSPPESMTTRLQYFSTVLFGGEIFFGIEHADRIVALACCLQNLEPDALTLSDLSVNPEYKNRKLATKLVVAIRDYVKYRAWKPSMSAATQLGDSCTSNTCYDENASALSFENAARSFIHRSRQGLSPQYSDQPK